MTDDNDLLKEGSFNPDPTADAEPVGLNVEELNKNAPTFTLLYDTANLEADRTRELVSLANLPSGDLEKDWRNHGWGKRLDDLLGGGVCPGYMFALGAKSAGAGKTAFLMQIADGLALRTAQIVYGDSSAPLTPVLVVSEMAVTELTWRSLARWTDYDSRIFRAGRSATRVVPNCPDEEVAAAFEAARRALTEEPLGTSRRFMRKLEIPSRGKNLVEEIATIVGQWKRVLSQQCDNEVWPVIVIDPIQRWLDGQNEVEGLSDLVEALQQRAKADGWVVALTSDTNKGAAAGWDNKENKRTMPEVATGAFRSSYKLFHAVDAALFADVYEAGNKKIYAVHIVKNRWGKHLPDMEAVAGFRWNPTRARFNPLSQTQFAAAQPSKSTTKGEQRRSGSDFSYNEADL